MLSFRDPAWSLSTSAGIKAPVFPTPQLDTSKTLLEIQWPLELAAATQNISLLKVL